MIATSNITLDVLKPNIIPMVYAKAGDSRSRFLTVTVTEGGVQTAIPQSSTVYLDAKRPDCEREAFLGEVNEDGTISFMLPDWLLLVSGLAKCSVSVIDGNVILTTLSFQLTIEPYEATIGGLSVYVAKTSLSAGTYYLMINNTPYSFTTTQTIPAGGSVVFTADLQYASTEYEGTVIESGLVISNTASGTLLQNGDSSLYDILVNLINQKSTVTVNQATGTDLPYAETLTVDGVEYVIGGASAEYATAEDIEQLWS